MKNSKIKDFCKEICDNVKSCIDDKKIPNRFCRNYYMDDLLFCSDNGVKFPELEKVKNKGYHIDKYSYWVYY